MRGHSGETFKTFEREGFEVRIVHVEDESPDLSFMGEFHRGRGTPDCFPYYDRATKALIHGHEEEEANDAESVNWSPREWRYIGKFQTWDDDREANDKALLHDINRLETYGEQWSCVGVVARVYLAGVELASSGGLWGIETDSDASYFDEVGEEQAAEAIEAAKAKLAELCGASREEVKS